MPSDNINNNISNNYFDIKFIGTIVLLIVFVFGGIFWYNNDNNEAATSNCFKKKEESTEDSKVISVVKNNQISFINNAWWVDYLISLIIFVGVFFLMIFVPISPLRLQHRDRKSNKSHIYTEDKDSPIIIRAASPRYFQRCYVAEYNEIMKTKEKIENAKEAKESGITGKDLEILNEILEEENDNNLKILALRKVELENLGKGFILYLSYLFFCIFFYFLIALLMVKNRISYSFGYILKNIFLHALSMKNYYVIWNAFLTVLSFSLYAAWFESAEQFPFGKDFFVNKKLRGFPVAIENYIPKE